MPIRTRSDFAPYVRHLADLMGLRDWTLYVRDDQRPVNPKADAEIRCWKGRKHATVLFDESFLHDSEGDQRHTVVHELIHCHFAAMDEIAKESLPAAVDPAWNLAMEYGVDGLADVLAPFLPLPTQVEARRPGPRKDGRRTMGRQKPVEKAKGAGAKPPLGEKVSKPPKTPKTPKAPTAAPKGGK